MILLETSNQNLINVSKSANERNMHQEIKEMINYFGINNDASLIIWSHAVNSRARLAEAIKSNSMFLEADILFIESKHKEPIMAHPPQIESDLTFTEWLNETKSLKKGLKLDFKTSNSVEPCLKILKLFANEISVPVILNADVFQGENSPKSLFDAHLFVKKCNEFYPLGILSLGLTTTNDINTSYSWSNVYFVYEFLKELEVLNSNIEITFPLRLMWSIKSLNRLICLHKLTKGTITLWSHETDELTSLESILLFRKFFPKSVVYYDLPSKQNEFFRAKAYKPDEIEDLLNKSNDKYVKSFIKENLFTSDAWNTLNGILYKDEYSVLMINNGASLATNKEYKAVESKNVYEIYGKMEIFSLNEREFDNLEKVKESLEKNLTSNDMDNLLGENKLLDNGGCVRISIRSTNILNDKPDPSFHSPGSINIYIYKSGLVKIFVGSKLEQEGNLQPLNNFEYFITDVGESKEIHIDLNSYDSFMNKFSLQLLVKSQYHENQLFYVTKTLYGNDYGVGIDALKIYDDIADPQDLDINENQN